MNVNKDGLDTVCRKNEDTKKTPHATGARLT
jgi:hypothetical protein